MHKKAALTVFALLFTAAVVAGPPPWAPAHGYRDKAHYDYDDYRYQPPLLPWHGRGYDNPFIHDGYCDRDRLGTVLGGVIGGVAGSRIGKGDGRTVATVAGTVLGALVGRAIGRYMDETDQQCTGQVLEHAPDNVAVHWQNPDDGARYEVTPVRTYRDRDGQYCREYTTSGHVGRRSQQVYGTACRQADGSWRAR